MLQSVAPEALQIPEMMQLMRGIWGWQIDVSLPQHPQQSLACKGQQRNRRLSVQDTRKPHPTSHFAGSVHGSSVSMCEIVRLLCAGLAERCCPTCPIHPKTIPVHLNHDHLDW